ncbi:hypothetical protein HAX54_021202 [Datura stramonium]|uniref:Uncharacterized protein n=1 Tax=Datura stramonium TaxID=4076 RepID=A0ABS8S398_DATST|nr:hypothetical protein [Datura stramonium]
MQIIGKGNWNKTKKKQSVRLGKKYMQRESSSPRWLAFWRRIKMHKKKSFNNNNSNSSSCVYDEETYMQNFDEGSSAGRVEPDILYRSFSARISPPTQIPIYLSSIPNMLTSTNNCLEEPRLWTPISKAAPYDLGYQLDRALPSPYEIIFGYQRT